MPDPSRTKPTRAFWFLFALIIVLSAILRVFRLAESPPWLDECCTILTITHPGGILADLKDDTNPPLYFFLLKAWSGFFGLSTPALRAFSAIAGIATVAALILWLRRCLFSGHVALLAGFLLAVSPLHIRYSQEIRGYTFMVLAGVLACWSFYGALRRNTLYGWIGHAVLYVAAIYAHDVNLCLLPAFWVIAWVEHAGKRWSRILISHTAAMIAYVPYFLYGLGQSKQEGLRWIAEFWRATPPALALPKSLWALTPGGRIPEYIRAYSPAPATVWLAAVWIAVLALALPLLLWRHKRLRSRALGLAVLIVFPLGALFVYSILRQPIYLVGRYDLCVQPAWTALLAASSVILAQRIRRRVNASLLSAVPLMIWIVLSASAIWPHLRRPIPGAEFERFQDQRIETIAKSTERRPHIITLAQEYAKIRARVNQAHLPLTVHAFPPEIARHPGWFNEREAAGRGVENLRKDARTLIASGIGEHLLWVVLDMNAYRPSGNAINPYTVFADALFAELAAAGWTRTKNPSLVAQKLRLIELNRL
jgi:hypothetical protein